MNINAAVEPTRGVKNDKRSSIHLAQRDSALSVSLPFADLSSAAPPPARPPDRPGLSVPRIEPAIPFLPCEISQDVRPEATQRGEEAS